MPRYFWTSFPAVRLGVSAATAWLLIFACSCGLFSSIESIPGMIDSARTSIVNQSNDWQRLLGDLQTKLERDAHEDAKAALATVEQILQESIQMTANEIACNTDIIIEHIDISLQRLVHSIKRDHVIVAYVPHVCTIVPSIIDLNKPTRSELSISGAFFFDAPKPRLAVEAFDASVTQVTADIVSRVTAYQMRVDLNPLWQQRLIGSQSKRLLIYVPPDTKLPSEILVVQQATCSDGIKNGSETDVDCGGSCTPCQARQACLDDNDCLARVCMDGRCGKYQLGGRGELRPLGGGTGGSTESESSCDSGWVATGFYANTGTYFDSIGLLCSELRDDGTVGAEPKPSPKIGGSGGPNAHFVNCNAGEALIGFGARTGAYIDMLKARCAYPKEMATTATFHIDEKDELSPSGGGQAGGGGNCSVGGAVVRLHVKSANWIDSLQFGCQPIQRVKVGLPPSVSVFRQ